jgi:multicomponent K+:H+ antiporter subunit C
MEALVTLVIGVLTAIVIGFAMTAFVIMLALRARAELGNDHVDGRD